MLGKSYAIEKEIVYENNFYYLTSCGEILLCKPSVCLPKHPMVSLKYNSKDFFIERKFNELPTGLVLLVAEAYDGKS